MSGDFLFPLPDPTQERLTVRRGGAHFNYMRHIKGQNYKINLRDNRNGKIVATIYGGEDMADYIVKAINAYKDGGAR